MKCAHCGLLEGDEPGPFLCEEGKRAGFMLTPAGLIRVGVGPATAPKSTPARQSRERKRPAATSTRKK
jgi:hypothetical protein